MDLSGLLPLIEDMPAFRKLIQELQTVRVEKRLIILDAA
jgi:hypothetical protein